MISLRSVFLLLSLFTASSVLARTWHVAPGGRNANNGTGAAPFRTISRAAEALAPGDELCVAPGLYYEQVKIAARGTAQRPIRIHPCGAGKAVIDGSAIRTRSDLVTLDRAAFVEFSGFEVRYAPRIGISIWGSHDVTVRSCEVRHAGKTGIYAGFETVGLVSNIVVDGCDVHDNARDNERHTMTDGGWGSGIAIGYTRGALLTNNRVHHNHGEGVGCALATDIVIRGNVVYDNFSANIYLDNAQGAQVDRNFVYSTGDVRYFRAGFPAAGIQTANETYNISRPLRDIAITNNIVVNSRWAFAYGAYENGGGLKKVTVANNTFCGAAESLVSIDADAHRGSVIENNLFYQPGGKGRVVTAGGGIAWRNNGWFGVEPGPAASAADLRADPLLANAGGLSPADYRLRSGSPAVSAGVRTAVVTTDFFGTSRGATFDLGAHQRGR